MHIEPNEIHVWSTDLTLTEEQEKNKFFLLSADERERAQRFHFPIHRQRFIAARSTLRELLSRYVNTAAKDLLFSYDEYKKPYLQNPHHAHLQFNLAHSANLAVYAFTLNHAVGIDTEKIEHDTKQEIAARFFSPQENAALMQLPQPEQIAGFYRIWSRKEALIKAVGKGLSIPLSSFSVSVRDEPESIHLENETWTLLSLPIHPDYQSALASNQTIKKLSYWNIARSVPKEPNM